MHEELHYLVDQLMEADLPPALELIRGRVEHGQGRNLPFFSSGCGSAGVSRLSQPIAL